MIGFPLDSHVSYDEDGTPKYDRAITSEPYRKLLKELFKTGVMPSISTNMQVAAGTGMNVIVKPGFAMVEGCMKLEEEVRTLAVQASSATLDRIDTVVLRLDDNDAVRICDFYIVEGVAASSPVRPTLNRSGSIYEIGLADIFISKGDTQISNSKITDTRYEDARCGVISSLSEFDTTTLNQQMNTWSAEQRADFLAWRANEESEFNAWEETQEEDFAEWFESIKDILDTNIGAHLQSEIDEIKNVDIAGINEDISDINDEIVSIKGTTLTKSLAIGSTTLTFNNESITNTSMIDLYTDVYGVSPISATQTAGSLTLVFDKQQSVINVKVVIK